MDVCFRALNEQSHLVTTASFRLFWNICTTEPWYTLFECLCESNSVSLVFVTWNRRLRTPFLNAGRYFEITSYWTYVHNVTLLSPSLNASILVSSIPPHLHNVKYLTYVGHRPTVWNVRRTTVNEEEANHTEIFFSTLWGGSNSLLENPSPMTVFP